MMESIIKEPANSYPKADHKGFCHIQRMLKISYDRPNYMIAWEKEFYKQQSKSVFFIPKADLIFNLMGKNYKIPSVLKHIKAQIEDAIEILEYPDNWDDEGALATDKYTFEQAVSFVIDYTIHNYYRFAVILGAPYIDILRDGSVSVHWKTKKEAQLFIIFKKENRELAYYYAESSERRIPLNSAIQPGAPVDETLALWMKNHLT